MLEEAIGVGIEVKGLRAGSELAREAGEKHLRTRPAGSDVAKG